MDWTLTTDRTVLELAAAVAVLVAAGVGASAFLKTSKIVAVLRFCLLLAAATLFVDPVLTRRVEEKPTVVLTLDDSASARRSLDGSGKADAETVWARCVALAEEGADAARRRGFPVKLQTLSGETVATFDERQTPSASQTLLRELPKRGAAPSFENETKGRGGARERILLFSDGIQNGGAERRENAENVGGEASGRGAVDAVAVGVSTGKLDWRWGVVDAPSTVYPGSVATLRAELRLENGASERSATQGDKRVGARRAVVRLWETPAETENGGEKETAASAKLSSKLVWERVVDVEIDADGRGVCSIERDWKPEQNGVFDYFLFVADFKDAEKMGADFVENAGDLSAFDFDEFCPFNNAATFRVETKAKKLDVLLVDDEPRYEYRYLRELLRREEGVALKTLLFSVDDAVREGDETALAPRELTRRRLAEFDAILIGDVPFERWGGKAQTLVDVATQDESETSIWFLGGEKTLQNGENGENLASLLAGNWLGGGKRASGEDGGDGKNGEETGKSAWRLAPTPRGRELFAGLTDFWGALDAKEAAVDVEFWRVFDGWTPGVGTETLFNARNVADGRETPLFVVATLGKNKALAQGTDELWRLRTLGDKTVYRRFVLRALEFLTDGSGAEETARADAETLEAAKVENDGEKEENVAPFDLSAVNKKIKDVEKARVALALETQDVAARTDVLQEIANATDGETLDLRDLDSEAARAAAKAFFERRFDEYPPVVVERSTRTPGKNGLFLLLFVFWGVAWALERRLDGAARLTKKR